MNGSIRKRGDGAWEICIEQGYGSDGKRRRQYITVRGQKRDAQRKLREILADADRGRPSETSKLTFREFAEQWFEGYVETQTKPWTAQSYRYYLDRNVLPYLGDLPLLKVQTQDIENALAALRKRNLAEATISKSYTIISEILKHARKRSVMWVDPTLVMDKPKISRCKPVIPTVEDVLAFLDATKGTSFHAIFTFIAHTGCRRGEALALHWRDIDFDNGRATITQAVAAITKRGVFLQSVKSVSGERTLDLGPDILRILRAHRIAQLEHRVRLGDIYQDQDLVFAHSLGGPLSPGTVASSFTRLVHRYGFTDLTMHKLRHFHASMMISAGVPAKVIQERLGHANIGITMNIYGHIMPGVQAKAVADFERLMHQAAEKQDPSTQADCDTL